MNAYRSLQRRQEQRKLQKMRDGERYQLARTVMPQLAAAAVWAYKIELEKIGRTVTPRIMQDFVNTAYTVVNTADSGFFGKGYNLVNLMDDLLDGYGVDTRRICTDLFDEDIEELA